eukprot:scaffold2044_cov247-Pinguiococcus_pyrenoidosus.AAC.16
MSVFLWGFAELAGPSAPALSQVHHPPLCALEGILAALFRCFSLLRLADFPAIQRQVPRVKVTLPGGYAFLLLKLLDYLVPGRIRRRVPRVHHGSVDKAAGARTALRTVLRFQLFGPATIQLPSWNWGWASLGSYGENTCFVRDGDVGSLTPQRCLATSLSLSTRSNWMPSLLFV